MRRSGGVTQSTTRAGRPIAATSWLRSLFWHSGRPTTGFRFTAAFAVLAVSAVSVIGLAAPASAATVAVHEITANWYGSPAPTTAPFGQSLTGEWHISTNDANDPQANDPVDNVRATLTIVNGVFTSIPAVCKTTGVTPVSSISSNGATLICNVGTVKEGTATVIQAPIRVSGQSGGNLSASGTVTSDSAAAPTAPASPPTLPITYTHGMDLSLNMAPGTGYQGDQKTSRSGGTRTFMQMNFSLILAAGSRPGPASYSFPVTISSSIPAEMAGLQWEDCVPVSATSASTGQPFSDPTQTDRTNFPTCAVAGSGASYTVTASNLTYTLVHTPQNDSLNAPLGGTGAYVASGTVEFSIPAEVTAITTFTFNANAAGSFNFTDGSSSPDVAGDNTSTATLTPPGGFSDVWAGTPTNSRSSWDANLWVSAGTSQGVPLPAPGIADLQQLETMSAAHQPLPDLPLYMQANDEEWQSYNGPGAPQMAGTCTLSQNPNFVFTSMDGGGYDATFYHTFSTARFFYTTATLNTKTETCGEAAPSAMWTEVIPPAGKKLDDPRGTADILMSLPAGVTGIKMTWNPAVDKTPSTTSGEVFLRGFGYIKTSAPATGEGWTIGAFNYPNSIASNSYPGYPTLNGYYNVSTYPGGIDLPNSTYGPNMNGIRDALRLQGPQGIITKAASDTSAQPGVPVTYTITGEAENNITSPPPVTFPIVDTLPAGMVFVPGSATPAPSSISPDGTTLTWTFTSVPANVLQTITYKAETPAGSVLTPGTALTNTAEIDVPGDQRPVASRQASATVSVPNSASTSLGKSVESNVLSFYGDSSAWDLTVNSQDPISNPFTDTIDILPSSSDGRGTNIDGSYSITGVTPPTGSTVYYSSAAIGSLSNDPRAASNGGHPGAITGNTVGWSTTPTAHPTAIRVIAPALAPGATQNIRIAFTTPSGTSCTAPAANDNKPGQVLVNSALSIAGHTGLPMLSSAKTTIGDCYALDLKKYVLEKGGDPANAADYHDANSTADYQQYAVGDTVPYKIVVTNKGTGTLTNVPVVDTLVPACNFTVASLAAGASASNTCTSTAVVGATVNTASATITPPTGPTLHVSDPAGIVVPAPYQVVKTSSPAPGTAVASGSKVTYTVTVSEPGTSSAPSLNPSLIDDMSKVLDDATYDGDVTASAGTASVSGSSLMWSATSIMPGESISITYSVTVNTPDAGDNVMTNVITTPPGSNCVTGNTDPNCTVTLDVQSFTVAKVASVTSAVAGDKVTYTVTVTNTGKAAYTAGKPASFTDSLTGVLDDAAYDNDGSTGVTYAAPTISWSGALAVGATQTVTYSVTVDSPDAGDHLLKNSVSPTGPGGVCASATSCATVTPVASYTVSKTASPASTSPGGTVEYTVTVTNTGAVAFTSASPATFSDSLSGVLDDATYNGDANNGATYVAPTISWAGSLAVGATRTITYSVTVNTPDSGNHLLTNAVVPTDPAGSCATAGACATTTPVGTYVVSKTASAITTAPGATVTYTIVVTNTGQVAYTVANPATVTDNLTGVLDDATYNNDASSGATYRAPTISWAGALAIGGTQTITYSVTVKNPDNGDHLLKNAVFTPPGVGNCSSGSTDPTCATSTPVQSYRAVKTSTATTVTPGQSVPYTITITNTGQVSYSAGDPATFTDDLSNVLDDATYNGDADNGATFAGSTISWSGPLAVGATKTFTYSVTINNPDAGDKVLNNAVVTGPTGNCFGTSTDPSCAAQVPTTAFHVVKTASSSTTVPGATVTYTITVTNTGATAYTAGSPAAFTDDLGNVLDDAKYNNDASNGAVYSAPTLSWQGALPVGGSETITYSVTVDDPDTGDHALDNTVLTQPGSGGNCPADTTDPDCAVHVPVQSYTTAKTASTTTATEGSRVTYTVTVVNTGTVAYTVGAPATFTDSLANVLDDAVYNNDATAGATYSAPVVSWAGALPIGGSVTVTYSVTVDNPDTGNHSLDNAVVPTATGGSCATVNGCATTTLVQSYSTVKTASSTTTSPGAVVTYTIAVTNTGAVDYTLAAPATFTDDLSQVLDDAVYNNDATNSATYSAPVLSWQGALAVGATETVTYSVTVGDPDTGDQTLDNAVVTPTGLCVSGSVDPSCAVSDPVQSYSVTKSASSTTSEQGATVTYTIVVANTGAVDYTLAAPATFTDDLTNVIDDATYNHDATNGAIYTSPVLSWSGALAVGGTEVITYSVTVDTPDTGDHLLKNSVVTPTGPCAAGSTDASCSVLVPVKSYEVHKQANATKILPGGVVSYAITVTNNGQVAFGAADPASFTDDLTNVLQNASYNSNATNGATYAAPVISWSGVLPVGASVEVTYSVTLKRDAATGAVLDNVVATPTDPTGTLSNCLPGDPDPTCAADVTVVAAPVRHPSPPSEIAFTGANAAPLFGTALALLIAGLATMVVTTLRRRRRRG